MAERGELSARVGDHFAAQWQDYDDRIRRTIPHYEGALEVLVGTLKRSCPTPCWIVDLGVGTGGLAARLLDAFPDARLTGIDLVPSYLEIAADRLERHADRVELIEGDIAAMDLPRDVDVFVTSFVLHHTEDATKRRVYEQIWSGLRDGGVMANADFVDSSSAHYSRVFDERRVENMRAVGMTESEISVHYLEHRKLERPTPLETQLEWLRDLGLADVECYWKYLNLAAFGGRKAITK
jgi:tRNA (cmo5U34)-methyltransferase